MLGKRPDTNQSQHPQQVLNYASFNAQHFIILILSHSGQRPSQSGHFRTPLVGASNAAEPPAKRAQTAQPLRPGTSVPNGGQRVEVSRVTPRDPLQFIQDSRHQQNQQNQQSEHFRQLNQRPQTQQGLELQHQQGLKSLYEALPLQLTTASSTPSSEEQLWGFRGTESAPSSVSHTVTPRRQDNDKSRDIRENEDIQRQRRGQGKLQRQQRADAAACDGPTPFEFLCLSFACFNSYLSCLLSDCLCRDTLTPAQSASAAAAAVTVQALHEEAIV